MHERTEATRFADLKRGDAGYMQALHDSRALALSGRQFDHWCDYDGPQWLGAITCAHCGGVLPGKHSCSANGADEVAAAHADAPAILARAADALSDLASLVESGSVRLLAYPSELPSLDELAAAVYAIETDTARTPGRDYVAREGDTFAGQRIAAGTLLRWDPDTLTHYPAS